MREFMKTKTGEWLFGIVFLIVLFYVSSFTLETRWRLGAPLVVVLIGAVAYVFLFRERYRGRWWKVALALAFGFLLGFVIFALRN